MTHPHRTNEALRVDLDETGAPLPETDHIRTLSGMLYERMTVQLPWEIAKDLGLTPKVETAQDPKPNFPVVKKLSDILAEDPEALEKVWALIQQRVATLRGNIDPTRNDRPAPKR